MPEKTAFSRTKLVRREDMPPPPTSRAPYVELGVATPFSFLRGASDAIELVLTALKLGYDGIGVAGVYTFELAETKVTKTMSLAKAQQFPLQLSIEPTE